MTRSYGRVTCNRCGAQIVRMNSHRGTRRCNERWFVALVAVYAPVFAPIGEVPAPVEETPG